MLATLRPAVRRSLSPLSLALVALLAGAGSSPATSPPVWGEHDAAPSEPFVLEPTEAVLAPLVAPSFGTGTHLDPAGDAVGDAPRLDLIWASVQNEGLNVVVFLVFGGSISPTGSGSANELHGYVDFDTDRNPATGTPSNVDYYGFGPAGLGCERTVGLSSYRASDGTMEVRNTAGGAVVGRVPARFFANAVVIKIPPQLLAISPTALVDAATIIGNALSPNDVLPNSSHLAGSNTAALLGDDRFFAEVIWQTSSIAGIGHLVPYRSVDSALFWFFGPSNWELMLKVLDGCVLNNHFWIFSAATTNQEYNLRVWDLRTGRFYSHLNPLGLDSPAVTDIAALDCP